MTKRFKKSGEGDQKVSPGRRSLSAKGEIRKHHHYGYVTGWGTRARGSNSKKSSEGLAKSTP